MDIFALFLQLWNRDRNMFKNLSTIFSGFNSKQNQNAHELLPKTRPSTPGHSTKDGRSSFQDTPYRASNNSLLNMSNPFEKAKEKSKSESIAAQNLNDQLQSTENLLDRSVKITFPKNNDCEVISEAVLRERVGKFGEVVNVSAYLYYKIARIINGLYILKIFLLWIVF